MLNSAVHAAAASTKKTVISCQLSTLPGGYHTLQLTQIEVSISLPWILAGTVIFQWQPFPFRMTVNAKD